MATKKSEIVTETVEIFTKEQFLKSNTYIKYRDLLTAVLDSKKTYTKEQVNNIINKYYKKGGN